MANLNFQRVSGQDLAENGSFAFKPHKEFVKKNAAVVLENLASKIASKWPFSTAKRTILASKCAILGSKWSVLGGKESV